MRYSIEPRDIIYVKGYGFLSFAKNIGKNLSNKYGQKLLDSVKKIYNHAIAETNIFRIQAYDSIMGGYFYIGFIDFMLAGKALTGFTNLFLPNKFKRNDIILKYFITNV